MATFCPRIRHQRDCSHCRRLCPRSWAHHGPRTTSSSSALLLPRRRCIGRAKCSKQQRVRTTATTAGGGLSKATVASVVARPASPDHAAATEELYWTDSSVCAFRCFVHNSPSSANREMQARARAARAWFGSCCCWPAIAAAGSRTRCQPIATELQQRRASRTAACDGTWSRPLAGSVRVVIAAPFRGSSRFMAP